MRFFNQAIKQHSSPKTVVMDKSGSNKAAILTLMQQNRWLCKTFVLIPVKQKTATRRCFFIGAIAPWASTARRHILPSVAMQLSVARHWDEQ